MTNVQKADSAAKRQALVIISVGVIVGTLLIFGLVRYKSALVDWLLSEPEQLAYRLRLFCFLIAFAGSVPLFVYSAHLWYFGCKVLSARRFPPKGQSVIRHTPILEGKAALSRGRVIKLLAASLAVFGVILFLALWRIASTIGPNAD
jgi:hypothetical protein